MNNTQATSPLYWRGLGILYLAGCALTLHIGKMPAALPLLKDELSLSLTAAGTIVGMYAFLSAVCALFFGLLVVRIGYVKFAVVGLALSSLGSFMGAAASSYSWLLMSRSIEGAGWILAVLALPALVSTLSKEQDRPLVMGIWGSFVPVGAGFMLFISPLLLSLGGWRFSWVVAGTLCLISSLCVALVCKKNQSGIQSLSVAPSEAPLFELKRPSVWLLGACFMAYSFQFLSVTSFLPIMLSEKTGLTLDSASRWAALVMLANAIGNIAAGWFVGRGMRRDYLMIVAAISGGLLAMLVYADFTATWLRIVCAILFSCMSGLIPGVAWATVPVVAKSVASVGLLVAVLLQTMAIGQLFGPIALPAVVEWSHGNWAAAGYMMLVVSIVGAVPAYLLGRRLDLR